MIKYALLTTLLVLPIFGCSSPVVEPEPIPLQKFIPAKPDPIQTYKVEWKVDSKGNIILSSQDGVKVNAERKDTVRYIKELQALVCYYESSYSFCSNTSIPGTK